MGYPEHMAFLSAAALYWITSFLLLLKVSPKTCRALGALILVVQGFGIGLRWAATGHPPVLGTFEETLAASWALTLFFVLVDTKGDYGRVIMPFAFLTLVYGFWFDTVPRPLIISEQSLWVYFHALFAWLAYGFYALSLVAAVRVLIGKDNTGTVLYDGLLYGFTCQTVMYVLGAYYSSRLHGNWWLWDPVEYLFLLSWLLYAAPLHGRLFLGWRPKKLAAWTVAAFASTMLLYWALVYMPWATYHVFDPEIKVHAPY